MKYQKIQNNQEELFRNRLSNQLNMNHELIKLSSATNWSWIETEIASICPDKGGAGRKALPIRLVIGLLLLQNIYNLSDEEVIKRWVENPYWQYFCGYDYLQLSNPLDASSLTRWRKRLGASGMEKILTMSIETGLTIGAVKPKHLEEVSVDTTVMPKNISFPTDTKLLHKAIEKMGKLAVKYQLKLRQSYKFKAKRLSVSTGRYLHAKKFKLANKSIRSLKTITGRLMRDCSRKVEGNLELEKAFTQVFRQAQHLITRKKTDSNKIYSLHEEEAVSCISKGKAHKKYEFGSKVALSVTNKGLGLITSAKAFHNNPHDGHTLLDSLKLSETITGIKVKRSFVDKGYKGHGIKDSQVFISGQKRDVTPAIKKKMLRRQAIEAHIGHAKSECKLGLSRLKGKIGDEINALLSAAGYNWKQLMNFIMPIFGQFFTTLIYFIFQIYYDLKYQKSEN